MRSSINFHGSDEHHKASVKKSIQNVTGVSETEKKYLSEYADMMFVKVSAPRVGALVSRLCGLSKHLKDYDKFTSSQYERLMDTIRNSQEYSESYKQDLTRDLKRYCIWLKDQGTLSHVSLETINHTRCVVAKPQQKDSDVVMTDDEIQQFLEAETKPKYRCFFSVLSDAGCRPSELSALKWSDVRTLKDGSMGLCLTQYKGGKAKRFVPLSSSVPVLTAYHDLCAAADGYVFSSQKGNTLTYQTIYNEFNRVMKVLGWTGKPYTLYSFRHSRITKAVRSDVNLEVAKRVFWGNANTQMMSTYTHLTTDDIAAGMRGH